MQDIDLCGKTISEIHHDCRRMTIRLDLAEADEKGVPGVRGAGYVLFRGVVASGLTHAMSQNLCEGIRRMDIEEFFLEWGSEFRPPFIEWPEIDMIGDTLSDLKRAMVAERVHPFVVFQSAWGLRGWVLAKEVGHVAKIDAAE